MALIKPVVFKGLVQEGFGTNALMKNLATNADPVVGVGGRTAGETVNFYRWDEGEDDAVDFVKGQEIEGDEVDQNTIPATIQIKAKRKNVYDSDSEYTLGSMAQRSADVISETLDRAIDGSLTTNALSSPLKQALASETAITQAELLAGFAKFGDQQNTADFSGIVINSLLQNSFYDMPLFVDLTKATARPDNGIPESNILGFFRGLPVYIQDKGTLIGGEAVAMIIKTDALQYKEDGLNVEAERQATYKRTNFVGDIKFATARVSDKGIVVLRKTIA